MKVSLNHLKDFVDIDVSLEELSELFNLHSGEVEEYSRLVDASNLVVGYVKEIEKHPDADKLNVCQVDLGDKVEQIVCGAPNVSKGQHVIVSKVGAVLPGGFKIKQSNIRGVESNGMICSLAELGIDKKYVDASGIHVIKQECKPGDNPLEVLNLVDEVMALDLTPNRADLLSVMGVAYDAAAILDKPIKLRNIEVQEINEENPVTVILDTENCMSYYTRVLKNIKIQPSPSWLQSRLIAEGVRPINNVVDITNYVMLETGQPLHAFDYDKLGTNKIVVRMANDGEELVTLDEEKRTLDHNDIVITNGEKAVALGGVMGGYNTEIDETTTRVLLESAVFHPLHIRKTSRKLDLRSEASTRFERKVDPKRTKLALELATQLFIDLALGESLKGIKYIDNIDHSEKVIQTSQTQINHVLGSSLSLDEITTILRRLHFDYTVEDNNILVTAPSRRQDIETYQDIIEEIGRIYGYDNLPLTLPKTVKVGQLSPYQEFKRSLKTKLTNLGLTEVITYSLISEDRVYDFSKEENSYINLAMPMSSDRTTLSLSPLNGIIDVLKYNQARKNQDLQLFELGKRYDDKETFVLAGALTGISSHTNWKGEKEVVDFYTVKGILDTLFESTYLGHLTYEKTDKYKNLHPGQTAIIKDFRGEVGFIGKLHPEYAKKHNLKNVFVFELDVHKLFDLRRVLKKQKEISKFPDMSRDIAIVCDKTIEASTILNTINKAGKRMLISAQVFDLYLGEPLSEHEKSLAIKLVFSDPKRTLETKEVDERVQEILDALKNNHNAVLR
jgi:phenylalanyl-tRNA synthetase beta chain